MDDYGILFINRLLNIFLVFLNRLNPIISRLEPGINCQLNIEIFTSIQWEKINDKYLKSSLDLPQMMTNVTKIDLVILQIG